MSVTSIRLQDDLEKSLNDAANSLHRSKNWIINQAIREYLERNTNEQQRWQQTVEALQSASDGKLVGSKKVNEWLQSWGTENELPPPKP